MNMNFWHEMQLPKKLIKPQYECGISTWFSVFFLCFFFLSLQWGASANNKLVHTVSFISVFVYSAPPFARQLIVFPDNCNSTLSSNQSYCAHSIRGPPNAPRERLPWIVVNWSAVCMTALYVHHRKSFIMVTFVMWKACVCVCVFVQQWQWQRAHVQMRSHHCWLYRSHGGD